MSLALQPVRVATSSPDENGLLVFDEAQRLVALLVQLSDEHGDEAGHWFYEAGFGPMDGPDHPTFPDLDAAQAVRGAKARADLRIGIRALKMGSKVFKEMRAPYSLTAWPLPGL